MALNNTAFNERAVELDNLAQNTKHLFNCIYYTNMTQYRLLQRATQALDVRNKTLLGVVASASKMLGSQKQFQLLLTKTKWSCCQ